MLDIISSSFLSPPGVCQHTVLALYSATQLSAENGLAEACGLRPAQTERNGLYARWTTSRMWRARIHYTLRNEVTQDMWLRSLDGIGMVGIWNWTPIAAWFGRPVAGLGDRTKAELDFVECWRIRLLQRPFSVSSLQRVEEAGGEYELSLYKLVIEGLTKIISNLLTSDIKVLRPIRIRLYSGRRLPAFCQWRPSYHSDRDARDFRPFISIKPFCCALCSTVTRLTLARSLAELSMSTTLCMEDSMENNCFCCHFRWSWADGGYGHKNHGNGRESLWESGAGAALDNLVYSFGDGDSPGMQAFVVSSSLGISCTDCYRRWVTLKILKEHTVNHHSRRTVRDGWIGQASKSKPL